MDTTPAPIRLLITDDHALMRDGLRQLFALDPGIAVIGEAEDGAQLLDLLVRVEADLLLLDMSMPGLCGEALITRLRTLHPAVPILVLSAHDELRVVEAALRAGARGYLTKDLDAEMLLSAVHCVAAGESFIAPRLAHFMALRAGVIPIPASSAK